MKVMMIVNTNQRIKKLGRKFILVNIDKSHSHSAIKL